MIRMLKDGETFGYYDNRNYAENAMVRFAENNSLDVEYDFTDDTYSLNTIEGNEDQIIFSFEEC